MGGFGGTWSRQALPFTPGTMTPSAAVFLWSSGDTITLTLGPNDPIREVYIPIIGGVINVFLGTDISVTPYYVTQPNGCEGIPINPSQTTVTLQYAAGFPDQSFYVFAQNFTSGGFRIGPVGSQVQGVGATAPITTTGGTTPTIGLSTPLATVYGGTGTASPSLTPGTGITITGTPFNWIISSTSAGGVSSVGAQAPITSTGGTTPIIGLSTPLGIAFGGTGTTSPGLVSGSGISIAGGWPNQTVTNSGVISLNSHSGVVGVTSPDASIIIGTSGSNITLEAATEGSYAIGNSVMTTGTSLAPSLIIPLGATTWAIELIWAVNQSSGDNNNRSFTITLASGSVSGAGNTGDGRTAMNATYYGLAMYTGSAAGGQTLTFTLATTASGGYAATWTLKAIRIS